MWCLAAGGVIPEIGAVAAPPAELAGASLSFNRDIRPILSDNCLACHGPDSAERKASLRLDTHEGLFGSRKDGVAVTPGKPDASLVWTRISTADEDDLMPPADSHKRLTAEQKAAVRRWIEQGAVWEPHWSLKKPDRPTPPVVQNRDWLRNPIDAFVLAKLESVGLKPAEEADRRTLARRLSFDLIGLPPTPDDVEAFVADPSPDAYEKYVDRLMARPQWGEHRGRYWLDAARYGDTHGIHNDNYREMWAYRDWVIDAFNRNIPFDRFVVEQVAGDLLPNRTLETRIASGFQRCNITTSEGGSIAEEVQAMYDKDRVETTGTVFLGLTLGCAACHDHKFDPITQRDFYTMAAFFRNTTQPAMDGNKPDTPPVVVVPNDEDRPRWEKLTYEKERGEKDRAAARQAAESTLDQWIADGRHKLGALPLGSIAVEMRTPGQSRVGAEAPDAPIIDFAWNSGTLDLKLPAAVKAGEGPAKDRAALYFSGNGFLDLPHVKTGLDEEFSVGGWFKVPQKAGDYGVALGYDGPADAAAPAWSLSLEKNVPVFRLFNADRKLVEVRGVVLARDVPGKWIHLLVTYDGTRRAGGTLMYVNGKLHESKSPDAYKPLAGEPLKATSVRLGSDGKRGFDAGGSANFCVYKMSLLPDEVTLHHGWLETSQWLSNTASEKLTKAQRETLLLLRLFDSREPASYRNTSANLAVTEAAMREIAARSPVTHVMAEKPDTPATARILFRGQYDQPKDEVKAMTPAALHPFPDDAPQNRLGLARWIIDPANPLTSRVTVNRLWQEVFGTGIVRTSEDFGIMGENPSHPELLDWLAVEFRTPADGSAGGDFKKFFKLIVTSATYRQAAATTPRKLAGDPQNRLLSRGPRFRMDAEVLRDFALASSGLLVDKIGGPSVKPYQPPGVWEAVAMKSSNTRDYKPDTGEGLYRRSMYWFWKRSAPPAPMDLLNAPTREVCTVRRERTNTPMQALVTMNDPQWVEAARRLAERTLKEAEGASFNARLDFITMRVIARKMDAGERRICQASLNDFLATYKADVEAARKLTATGESKPDEKLPPSELAAWTMLCSQLMNLDEALNK